MIREHTEGVGFSIERTKYLEDENEAMVKRMNSLFQEEKKSLKKRTTEDHKEEKNSSERLWKAIKSEIQKNHYGIKHFIMMYGCMNCITYFIVPKEEYELMLILNAFLTCPLYISILKSTQLCNLKCIDGLISDVGKNLKRKMKVFLKMGNENNEDMKKEETNIRRHEDERTFRKIVFEEEDINDSQESEEIPKKYELNEDKKDQWKINKKRKIIFEEDLEKKTSHPQIENFNMIQCTLNGELLICQPDLMKQIFCVYEEGKIITFKVSFYERIGNIKRRLKEEKNINQEEIKIMYEGKFLKDELYCYDYNIREGATIFIMNSIIGGSRSTGKNNGQKTSKKAKASIEEEEGQQQDDEKEETDIYEDYIEDKNELKAAKLKVKEEEYYTMHVDGSAVTNPGIAGVGYIVKNMKKMNIFTSSIKIKNGTNNYAEYMALIYGLKSAISLGIKRIQVFSDSALVVNQVNGQWKVNEDSLIPYHKASQHLLENFQLVTLEWIPRENNQEADSLAKLASGEKSNTPPKKKRGRPAKKGKENEDFEEIKDEKDQDIDERNKDENYEGMEDEMIEKMLEIDRMTKKENTKRVTRTENKISPIKIKNENKEMKKEKACMVNENERQMVCYDASRDYNAMKSNNGIQKNTELGLYENENRKNMEIAIKNLGFYNNEQEKKLWHLYGCNQQIMEQINTFSTTMENIMEYGISHLEPWRNEIDYLVDGILGGAKCLETMVNSTIQECQVFHHRLEKIENEIFWLKEDNAVMKKQLQSKMDGKNHSDTAKINECIQTLKKEKDGERDEIVQKIKEIETTLTNFKKEQENELKKVYKTMMNEFQNMDRRMGEIDQAKSGNHMEKNWKINDRHQDRQELGMKNEQKTKIVCEENKKKEVLYVINIDGEDFYFDEDDIGRKNRLSNHNNSGWKWHGREISRRKNDKRGAKTAIIVSRNQFQDLKKYFQDKKRNRTENDWFCENDGSKRRSTHQF